MHGHMLRAEAAKAIGRCKFWMPRRPMLQALEGSACAVVTAMPQMTLLQLEPENTLYFCKTPMTSSPNRMLKLTNNHTGNVAFKVKTTAPKAYLVRPSSGTLRPRDFQEVQIILQPQGTDGQANNHRFLVQAVAVADTEPVSREDWAKFPKENLQEQRLNVVLEEREADDKPVKPSDNAYGSSTSDARAGASSAEGATDLKIKYDELVQYTLLLEKEKKKLEADLAHLQSAKPNAAGEGFSKLTLIFAVLVAFLVPYAAKFLG